MKAFRRALSVLMVVILCFSSSNVSALAHDNTDKSDTAGYTFDVSYQIVNAWENSKQVSVCITNTGNVKIENWALQYDYDGDIVNIWNAKVFDDEKGIITNLEYNSDIKPGESTSFGYIIENNEITPNEFKMVQKRVVKKDGFEVTLQTDACYGNGFNGTIYVKNLTGEAIRNWNVSFDADFTINSIWSANILSKNGNSYLVEGGDGNTVIPAEGVVSFGFCGSYEEKIAIDNIVCTEVIADAEGNVPAGPENPENPEDYPSLTWDEMLDTDGDELPDVYEQEHGLDYENPDTDGDGLTDGYEVIYCSSDPLNKYTLDDGILDADRDPDGDGLTFLEEYKLGTHPLRADSDGDKLNDYEEIYIFHTDPNNEDTDGDTVLDGDETAVGLDPKNPETFGYPDKDYVYTVTLDANADKLSKLSKKDYELDIAIEGKGDILSDLYVRKSNLTKTIEADYIVGDMPEIVYKGEGEIASVTLNFAMNKGYLFENDEIPELGGIHRFGVFMYDKEEGILAPVDTTYDETTQKISATVSATGAYAVVDLDTWIHTLVDEFDSLKEEEIEEETQTEKIVMKAAPLRMSVMKSVAGAGNDAKESAKTEEVSAAMAPVTEKKTIQGMAAPKSLKEVSVLAAAPVATPTPAAGVGGTDPKKVDLVIVYHSELHSVTDPELIAFEEDLMSLAQSIYDESGSNARIYLVDTEGNLLKNNAGTTYASYMFSFKQIYSKLNKKGSVGYLDNTLDTLINSITYREDANKVVLYFGDSHLGSRYTSLLAKAYEKGIKFIIDCPATEKGSVYYNMANDSDGMLLYNYQSYARDVLRFIYGYLPISADNTYKMVHGVTIKNIRLNGILNTNSGIDTDGDGAVDTAEVNISKVTVVPDGHISLPTYYDYLNSSFAGKAYLEWFKSLYSYLPAKNGKTAEQMLRAFHVLPCKSDPTLADTDGDGIEDDIELFKTDLPERYCDIDPWEMDTIESLFPELEEQNTDDSTYLTVTDNDIVCHLQVVFEGDTDVDAKTVLKTTGITNTTVINENTAIETRIGSTPTLKEVAIDGIESRWSMSFTGNQYDFIEGMNVTFATDVIEISNRWFTNDLAVEFKSGDCGVCHQTALTSKWKSGCSRTITMYNSYCDQSFLTHIVGKTGTNCPNYQNSQYTVAQYSGTVAHEFGHAMGLKDLYASAAANHGYNYVNNKEVYHDTGTFAMPDNGCIMCSNGAPTANDIEMILYAFSENCWQYYTNWGTDQVQSEAIRCAASYTKDGNTYTWDESTHSYK